MPANLEALEEYRSQCDCCGRQQYGCRDTTTGGNFPMDVHACPECLGGDEEDLENAAEETWARYVKSGKKPKDIPDHPDQVYGDDWRGWCDWLGWGKRHAR